MKTWSALAGGRKPGLRTGRVPARSAAPVGILGIGEGVGGENGKERWRETGREGTKGESQSQRCRDRGQRGPGRASHASSVPLYFSLMKAPAC